MVGEKPGPWGRERTEQVDKEKMVGERKGVCAKKNKSVSQDPCPRSADGQDVRMRPRPGREMAERATQAGCICGASRGS